MAHTAMITGGAGAMARALSDRLLQRGYDLILVDVDVQGLEKAALIAPDRIRTHRADLTRAGELEGVASLIAEAPNLSLFVNNAGVIRPGEYINIDYSDVALQMSVNLLAPIRLTHAAAARFAAQGEGCIFSIVSSAGLVALPGCAAYSASKFGLRGLLISLAMELEPLGVRVRSLFPGAVDTPMLRYEATHGGSVLNFLNKDVLSVEEVATAAIKTIEGARHEVILPSGEGLLSRLMCAFPALLTALLPHLSKQGERGLQRYLRTHGLSPAASR